MDEPLFRRSGCRRQRMAWARRMSGGGRGRPTVPIIELVWAPMVLVYVERTTNSLASTRLEDKRAYTEIM